MRPRSWHGGDSGSLGKTRRVHNSGTLVSAAALMEFGNAMTRDIFI
jgi:hypothetical protein